MFYVGHAMSEGGRTLNVQRFVVALPYVYVSQCNCNVVRVRMKPAQLRQREGLTMAGWSQALGIDPVTVWRWERRGGEPTGACATLLRLVERHGLRNLLGGKLAQFSEPLATKPAQPVAPKRTKRADVK